MKSHVSDVHYRQSTAAVLGEGVRFMWVLTKFLPGMENPHVHAEMYNTPMSI
jgi:hypothetical protein